MITRERGNPDSSKLVKSSQCVVSESMVKKEHRQSNTTEQKEQ